MDLNELRMQEDKKIIEHLKGLYEIISKKCKRCKNMQGCLGCVFSPGDGIKGYIRESVKMMLLQRSDLNQEIEKLFYELLN